MLKLPHSFPAMEKSPEENTATRDLRDREEEDEEEDDEDDIEDQEGGEEDGGKEGEGRGARGEGEEGLSRSQLRKRKRNMRKREMNRAAKAGRKKRRLEERAQALGPLPLPSFLLLLTPALAPSGACRNRGILRSMHYKLVRILYAVSEFQLPFCPWRGNGGKQKGLRSREEEM